MLGLGELHDPVGNGAAVGDVTHEFGCTTLVSGATSVLASVLA